jgi:hypothetical protein
MNSKGLSSEYFSILVNWNSDLWSSYFEYLGFTLQGEKSNGGALSKFAEILLYLPTDLVQSIIGAPKNWWIQGNHSIKSLTGFGDNPRPEHHEHVHVTSVPKSFDYMCHSTKQGQFFFWLGKLISTPLVAEIGRNAWTIMLRRSRTIFWKAGALDTKLDSEKKWHVSDEGYEKYGRLNNLLMMLRKLQLTNSSFGVQKQ